MRGTVAMMNTCVVVKAHRFVASPTDNFTWLHEGTLADRAALVEYLNKQTPDTSPGA